MHSVDRPSDEFSDRVLLDCAKRQRLPDRALAAVLEARRLLGLTLGVEIASTGFPTAVGSSSTYDIQS